MTHPADPGSGSVRRTDENPAVRTRRREPSPLAAIVERSHAAGMRLGDLVDHCLDRCSYELDRPFYEIDHAAEERFRSVAPTGTYELAFQLGCGENPFLTYADEPVLHVLLGLGADRLHVSLVDDAGEELGHETTPLDPSWTFIELADTFGELSRSPRLQSPVRRYLARWSLLNIDVRTLEAAATRLARALGSRVAPELDGDERPWRAWVHALIQSGDSDIVGRQLASLGTPDADARSLRTLVRIVERAETDLRLALEISLLLVGAEHAGPASPISGGRLESAARVLRALVAPDERLPEVLESRVRLLIDRMVRPPVVAPDELATETAGDSPHAPDNVITKRLEEIAKRYSWSQDEHDALAATLRETETPFDPTSLDQLEHGIGKYELSPRHIECALHVRRWCEAEGYGLRYEDVDPDTRVFAPPSWEAMFRFVSHFPDVPDVEEAIATLDDWIHQRFVDPRDFENDLFRHLRLIAYTEDPEAGS